MKNIRFITTKFLQIDYNKEENCYRLIAECGSFYFEEKQFKDFVVLKQLSKGDNIDIGSHQLADGTYWLHWLISKDKGCLTIRQKPQFTLIQKIALILPFPTIICLSLGFIKPSIFLQIICYITGVIGLLQFIYYIVCFFLPKQIKLRKAYQKLLMNDRSMMEVIPSQTQLDSIPSIELKTMAGSVQAVSYERFSTRKGITTLYIHFLINNQQLKIIESENTLTNPLIPHCYQLVHPTFIAVHDQLYLIFENEKVRAIINKTDASTYLICKHGFLTKFRIKIILSQVIPMITLSVILLPFVMCPFIDKKDIEVFFLLGMSIIFIMPAFIIFLHAVIGIFPNHSTTKQLLCWLKKILVNKYPKEI